MGPGVARADAAGVKAAAVGIGARSAGATARYAGAPSVTKITLVDIAGVGMISAGIVGAGSGVRIAAVFDLIATGVFEDPAERDIGALQGHVHAGIDDVATVIFELPAEIVRARLIGVATVADNVVTGVVLRATVTGCTRNHRTAIPDDVAAGVELFTAGSVSARDWIAAGLGVTVPDFTQRWACHSTTRRLC
jgi:hypothetical protein